MWPQVPDVGIFARAWWRGGRVDLPDFPAQILMFDLRDQPTRSTLGPWMLS
jgi:hypothetical protein